MAKVGWYLRNRVIFGLVDDISEAEWGALVDLALDLLKGLRKRRNKEIALVFAEVFGNHKRFWPIMVEKLRQRAEQLSDEQEEQIAMERRDLLQRMNRDVVQG